VDVEKRDYKALLFAVIVALVIVGGSLLTLEVEVRRWTRWTSTSSPSQPMQAASVSVPVTVTLASAQHITTTGQTSAVGVGYYREALAYISTDWVASAITYTLQTSPDKVNWYTYGALAAVATSSTITQPMTVFGPFVRLSWAVSGTTDVTTTAVLALKE